MRDISPAKDLPYLPMVFDSLFISCSEEQRYFKSDTQRAGAILERIDKISIGLIRQKIKDFSSDHNQAEIDPLSLFKEYLTQIGLSKYAETLKIYHLTPFKNGMISQPEIRAEILGKKAKILLNEKFGGNILEFVTKVHRSEITRPFVDYVNDVPVIVKTSTCVCAEGNFLEVMKVILKELGYEELAELVKEHHLAKPNGIYTKDEALKCSILERKFDSLLPKYGNDVVRMLCEFDQDEFIIPIKETLTDPKTNSSIEIEIETSTINFLYGGDRWKMIQEYLSIKELNDIKRDLKRYHLKLLPAGIYEAQDGKELLRRHLDAIRNNDSYKGNINKFSQKVTLPELEQPFYDSVSGRRIEVSTLSLTRHYKSSPSEMIKEYLSMQRCKKHGARFDEAFRSKSKSRSSQDAAYIRKVLFGKLEDLLYSKFDGNFEALKSHLTVSSIARSYKVSLNNRDSGRVVTATAWRSWQKMGGNMESLLKEFKERLAVRG